MRVCTTRRRQLTVEETANAAGVPVDVIAAVEAEVPLDPDTARAVSDAGFAHPPVTDNSVFEAVQHVVVAPGQCGRQLVNQPHWRGFDLRVTGQYGRLLEKS